jgi:ABC-2 type transport system permease protein
MLVAQRDYLRTVRRRGYVFGTMLLPLGIGTLMAISTFFSAGGGVTSEPVQVSIVVVNESAVPLSGLPGLGTLILLDEAAARAKLDAGEASEFYVVPETFPDSGNVTRVQTSSESGLAGLGTRSTQQDVLGLLLRQAMLREAGLSDAEAIQILQGVTVVAVSIDGKPVSDLAVAASIVVPMIFVGLFMISIFITSGYLLQSVTEEKENRVVEIVLSSIPSLPLMTGKILGLGAAGLTQVGIWVLTALVAIPLIGDRLGDVSGIAIEPAVLGLALVYFVLGYLAYGAIFAAIGAIAPGNREAQQYSGFMGFFAAIPFILFAVFLNDIDSTAVLALDRKSTRLNSSH